MRTHPKTSALRLALAVGASLLVHASLSPAGAVSASYGIATKLAGEFCAGAGNLDETLLSGASKAAEAAVRAVFLGADPDAQIPALESEERDEKKHLAAAQEEAKKLRGDLDGKLLGLRLKAQSDADVDEKEIAALLQRAEGINARLTQIQQDVAGLQAAIDSYRQSEMMGTAAQVAGHVRQIETLRAEQAALVAEKREIASDFSPRRGRVDMLRAQLVADEQAARAAAKSAIAAADRREAAARQRLNEVKAKLASARQTSAEMGEVLQEIRRCTQQRQEALAGGDSTATATGGGSFPTDGSLNGTYPLLMLTECRNGAGGEKQSKTGSGSLSLSGTSVTMTVGSGREAMKFGAIALGPDGRVSGTLGSGAQTAQFEGMLTAGTNSDGAPWPSGSGKITFAIDFTAMAQAIAGGFAFGSAPAAAPSSPENMMYCDVEWEML